MIKKIVKGLNNAKTKNKYLLQPVKNFKDKGLNKYGIQFVFVLIALLYASYIFFHKGIRYDDTMFHFLRLKDVILEIFHGQFPQFNFYTFMPIGNAINTFYPYLLLLPLLIILAIIHINGTTSLSVLIFVIVLSSLETCYYCFNHYLKFSQFSSFLISIFQWISSVAFLNLYDIGTTEAMIFIPISFTGWIIWITRDKWKLLTIGLCGIVLSNEPEALIISVIFLSLTILQWKRLSIVKIKAGIKASIVSLLILMCEWLPIIMLILTNKIYFPNQINIKNGNNVLGSIIPTTWASAFTPMGYKLWDLLELLAIILVIVYWKKLDTFIKQITILSITLLLTNSPLFHFKQFLQTHTILKVIQYTQRFNIITHFLLIISLIECLNIIIKQIKHKELFINIWYPEIIVYTCLLILIGGTLDIESQSMTVLNKGINNISVKNVGEQLYLTNNRTTKIFTNITPQTLHTASTSAQYPDYLPYSVLNNKIRNQMTYKTYHYYSNGMNFKEKYNKQLILPFVLYHTQKYYITDNKKPLHYHYYHHYIKVNLHKGENRIRITAPVMWYRYIGFLGTMIGITELCRKPKKDRND